MSFIYKRYIPFIVCAILTGAIVILAGCPSGIVTNSIDADLSGEYTILPQFANFPVIAPSASATQKTLVVRWEESYPVIKEYSEVIAVFPHSIEGWHILDRRFQLNTEYNLLEWRGVRQRGAYQLDIFDENSELRYEVTVTSSIASPFLDGVYTSIAGTGATLEEWWVSIETPEYFYVGGNDADNTWVGHQVIFVARNGETIDEHAILKSKAIEKSESISDLYTIPSSTRSLRVNINAIVRDMNDRESELCMPPEGTATYAYTHEYVVTRSRVVEGRLRALNGSQNFLLLKRKAQRRCFIAAYLFEILPSEKPVTTKAHRDSLPDEMRYIRAQYDLVFNEEYEDDTVQDLYDRDYYVRVIGAEPQDRAGYRDPYPYDATPYTHDDPIKIENGKLFMGYGLRSKYDHTNQRDKYECDPEKLSDPIEALNPEKCNVRSWLNQLILPYYFKYGFLEINFARTPNFGNSMNMWLRSKIGPLILNSNVRKVPYVDRKSVGYNLSMREVYNRVDDLRWETSFYGTEMQLMEIVTRYPSAWYWTVGHYGWVYTNGNGNERFFYTMRTENDDYRLASKYRYAIEWAPDGYIIWIDKGTGWIKYSDNSFNGSGNNGGSGVCESITDGDPSTINGVSGIIQCGINHVPMSLRFAGVGAVHATTNNEAQFRSFFAARRGSVELADKFIEIEHIRLYKPRNNYAGIEPLYQ